MVLISYSLKIGNVVKTVFFHFYFMYPFLCDMLFYRTDLQAFKNKYSTTTSDSAAAPQPDSDKLRGGSDSNKADQSHPFRVSGKMTDPTATLVEHRSSKDQDPEELLAPIVERHKGKNSSRNEYKRSTWLYKDNSDVRLYTLKQKQANAYKNLHMNVTQFKQQRLYSEKLSNKYNDLQKAKSLLLSKLGSK